jgi:protein AroM
LRAGLGDAVEVVESGALDGLASRAIPPATGRSGRPLVTRAPDGGEVLVDEGWLAPRVAALIDRAEAEGAAAVVLLCAGGFDEVSAAIPLIRPRAAALDRLRAMGSRRLVVLVPIESQVASARAAWAADGFDPDVAVGGPDDVAHATATSPRPDAVVLDFVGYPRAAVDAAAEAIAPIPLVDLSTEMVAATVATMRR